MYQKEDKPADDLVFGIRAVIEAIQAGKEIDKVLIKKGSYGVGINRICFTNPLLSRAH